MVRLSLTPGRRGRDLRRAAALALVATAVLAGLAYLGRQAIRASIAWLHQQAKYQVAFDQIELVTKPPAWYRGGPARFLEEVRQTAAEPAQIPHLDLAPEQIAVAFKKYAWVEDVAKVAFHPGRIVVDLRYRQPVAWVHLPRGPQRIVDDNGTILPSEDIDVEPLGSLIKITGDGLLPPSDPRPGVVWKARDRAADIDRADPKVVAAARLAGFLRRQTADSQSNPARALRVLEIIVTDYERRGLFVMNAEGAEIWWEDAPGEERPGKPSAAEKWQMLEHWQETTTARFLEDGDFWAFSRKGLHHVCPHPGGGHQPKSATGPAVNPPASDHSSPGSG